MCVDLAPPRPPSGLLALLQAHATADRSGADADHNPELLRQKEEYERRGISLAHFDSERKDPHLIALDRDRFRNKRLMYFLKPGGWVGGWVNINGGGYSDELAGWQAD